MAFIDYYKILGVSKDIPQDEVRAAYRKRAKQFHPDLHPDDPKAKAKFQALSEAYDVISDVSMTSMANTGARQGLRGKGATARAVSNGTRPKVPHSITSTSLVLKGEADFRASSRTFSEIWEAAAGRAAARERMLVRAKWTPMLI